MHAAGPTIALEPDGAGGPRPRAKIDVVSETSSHGAGENLPLLRKRLLFFNRLLAAIFFLVVVGADTPFILSGRGAHSGFAWLLAAEHALIVVVSGTLSYFLWKRGPFSLRALRIIELGTLAPAVAALVTDQFYSLVRVPLYEAWSLVQSTYAAGWSVYWLILIILYGTLIPNTWRRCATVTTTFGMLPVFLTLAAEAYQGWPTPAVPLFMFLTVMGAVLICAIPAIVYNVHAQEILRDEAREARRLGQYRLGRRLAKGGMGEVYLAQHLLLRRACAIKLIRPDNAADGKSLVRFEREVQATATLTHPNTIQIFDYGHTEDGTFYYVMEYLPGLTLDQLIQKDGPLPPGRAIHFLRQVLGALREAHAIGLIHRDIKPGNIIICERGGMFDMAKLLDFGLVLPRGQSTDGERLTQQGVLSGTPAYMSPEQADGREDLDPRSDIYSLGALAYFLLTGRTVFAGRSPMKMLAAHLCEEPEPMIRHRPDLPADLQNVVMRCLRKDPAERCADAENLDSALAACQAAGEWTAKDAQQWWSGRPHLDAVPGDRTDNGEATFTWSQESTNSRQDR